MYESQGTMYSRVVKSISDVLQPLLDRVEGIEDPTTRAVAVGKLLDEVPAIQAALRQLRQDAVVEMRDAGGMSHAQVAEALGTTRSRAQQIYEGKTRTAAGTPSRRRG